MRTIWNPTPWPMWLSEAQRAPVVFPKAFERGPTYTVCRCGFEGFGAHECPLPASNAGTVTVTGVDRDAGTLTAKLVEACARAAREGGPIDHAYVDGTWFHREPAR